MEAEDQRLKLAEYEVFRFGGPELLAADNRRWSGFVNQLAGRMKN